jgi:hypothetical protein
MPEPRAAAFRKQDLPELAILDGATIALRSSVLRETAGIRTAHAYLGNRVIVEIHDRCYATEIDTFDDVALAEFFLSRHA